MDKEVQKMTILELIKDVLQISVYPLTAAEIWDVACQKGLDKKLAHISPDPAAEIAIYTTKNTQDFIQYKFKQSKFWLSSRGDCSISLPFLLLEVAEKQNSKFPAPVLKSAIDFFQAMFDLKEGALSLKIPPFSQKPFKLPKKSPVIGRWLAILFGYTGLAQIYAEQYWKGIVQFILFISFPTISIIANFLMNPDLNILVFSIKIPWAIVMVVWWLMDMVMIGNDIDKYNANMDKKYQDYRDSLIQDWDCKQNEINSFNQGNFEKMLALFDRVMPVVEAIDKLPVKLEVLAGVSQGVAEIITEKKSQIAVAIAAAQRAEHQRLEAERKWQEEERKEREKDQRLRNLVRQENQALLEEQQRELDKKLKKETEVIKKEIKKNSSKKTSSAGLVVGVTNFLKNLDKKH